VDVYEQAAPSFVPLIERGVVDGPELEKVARGYLGPLKEEGVDAVILGCTHYPLISAPINRILGPEVRLISSPDRPPWKWDAYSPAAVTSGAPTRRGRGPLVLRV
jgi:glutamate racemase